MKTHRCSTVLSAALLFALIGSQSLADTHYVDINNTTPSHPYTNSTTAATTIQDAVDAASSGGTVLVGDGSYLLSSEILVSKAVTVRSVNGPKATSINGQEACRGFNLGSTACIISGFTVTKGYSTTTGGGIYCTSTTPVITNCTLSGNGATDGGGGSANGTLIDCTVSDNWANNGGGSWSSDLNYCTLCSNIASNDGGGSLRGLLSYCTISNNWASKGGGSYYSDLDYCTVSGNEAQTGGGSCYGTLDYCVITKNTAINGGGSAKMWWVRNCTISYNRATVDGGGGYKTTEVKNCTITRNSAGDDAGGEYYSSLSNCKLTYNTAGNRGGGTSSGWLHNCTVMGNSAAYGGGTRSAKHYNCVVWGNSATTAGANAYSPSSITYNTCAPDGVTHGVNGCITSFPRLDSNGRLKSGSPCINAGDNENASGTTDLDGNTRIWDGTVDMGAYEYDASAYDSDGDGLTDNDEINIFGTDPNNKNTDGDPMSDYEEYVADTSATNANDWFQVSSFSNNTIFFNSSASRQYTLLWSTNISADGWIPVTTRIGTGGADFIPDPAATNPACFYKVEVGLP